MGKEKPAFFLWNTDRISSLSPLWSQHAPEIKDDFGLLEIGYIACIDKNHHG